MNAKAGTQSSVGLLLDYKYILRPADFLADDDYCKNELFDKYVIKINPYRKFTSRYHISSDKRRASNMYLRLISTKLLHLKIGRLLEI